MKQFTFTSDELCALISTLVMCGSDKHPDGLLGALDYAIDQLGDAGKDDDICGHLADVLAGLYD